VGETDVDPWLCYENIISQQALVESENRKSNTGPLAITDVPEPLEGCLFVFCFLFFQHFILFIYYLFTPFISQDCLDAYQSPHKNSSPSKVEQEKLILINMIVKTMELALYFGSDVPPGVHPHHYALNVPLYTHFTSPIRRYADVVVHRQLAHALGGWVCGCVLFGWCGLHSPAIVNLVLQWWGVADIDWYWQVIWLLLHLRHNIYNNKSCWKCDDSTSNL